MMKRRHFLKSAALAGAGMATNLSVLSSWPATAKDQVYADETGSMPRIGNDLIELGFDVKSKGGLCSLIDKATGYQFVRHQQASRSLFRLALRRQKDRQVEWFDSREARSFHVTKREQAGGTTLVLEAGSFPDRRFTVKVEVTLSGNSNLSTWHMSVAGLEEEAVYQLTCPILSGVMKAGESVPGEALAVPRVDEGCVFRNPYPVVDHLPLMAGVGLDTPQVGMGEIHGKSPGEFPMQFMLYYNDLAGLYMACHDSKQNVKGFDIGKMADWEPNPVMSISHFPSKAMGGDAAFDYDTMVGVFHGDWYDGADIYKAWGTRQWWCAKKLWERDIPDWLRHGVGFFEMANYDMPVVKLQHPMSEIAALVNRLSKDAGVPIVAIISDYEGGGPWTGPPGIFPLREGDAAFKEALKQLRAAGNYGMVCIPAKWYVAVRLSPPYNTRPQFEAEVRPNAIMNDKGEADMPPCCGPAGPPIDIARLCPGTKFTEKTMLSMGQEYLERGISMVEFDSVPIASPEACYDAKHGHPLGYGPWYSDAWNQIIAEVRKQARDRDPSSAVATEGVSENFMPHVDMYNHHGGSMEDEVHYRVGDPMGGEAIPFFKYVYGGYIGAFSAYFNESNRPEILYWTRSLGKCLAQGVAPAGGWVYSEPKELNPVTIDFYKKVVRAAAQGWKYLMFGEMLRPPKIDVPVIAVSDVPWRLVGGLDPANRHVVKDYAVQHSAWRSREGKIGYFFANISQEAVEFEVELSSYSQEEHAYDVESVTDGKRASLGERIKLPSRQRFRLEPLSVTLVEVSRAS